ncbi:hypothetical protein QJV03_02075 [Listeria swaminathanii]|uniref:Uncharacterized protein n=1 Tax=Listeria swaminathanii TaxID=2713501 RepID=A0ABU2IFJ1_9LIST|nr:hypothetical protein [Listeria swaminathanii]MCD2246642.1 hypothetical protein [Listeria marthii]MDT0015971.1 hypothetical protein [Listeria swaminathanii]MDT0021407.1 hypothetical protein [Listeria swaminathanii]MDT0032371.1 hypothetical protein [Listeria swaminathanii]MDT0051779.1 hypothetical protein [Listeria swaminathanii]
MDAHIEKIQDVVELVKTRKYNEAEKLLVHLYETFQTESPKNIPEVYFKRDRIGYTRWENTELNELGKIIQKNLIYLDKQGMIKSDIVIAYIEGAEKMSDLEGMKTTDNLKVLAVLHGIMYAYSA